ncbi:hypothetical protein [Streptomyces hokutonensis]|uniref:hypothetical protein n=1 Tax=Streptomyces hokutonensis TaxID=1306990 RepID=UPI000369273F|nr:hypothetical protein [Streptomyces hokutonensis]
MRQSEPDFSVLEYITITKDLRTGLVLALGGTREAAGILQRACIPLDSGHTVPLAGARPETVLAEARRTGHRHHD